MGNNARKEWILMGYSTRHSQKGIHKEYRIWNGVPRAYIPYEHGWAGCPEGPSTIIKPAKHRASGGVACEAALKPFLLVPVLMTPTTVPGAEKKRRLRLPKPPGESTGGKAGRPKGKTAEKPAYESSAKPVETKPHCENLTYGDWLEVLDWKKSHPAMSQGDIVRHFATHKQRQLVFQQPALSKALGREAEIRARVEENPGALSSKRPRFVTLSASFWRVSMAIVLDGHSRLTSNSRHDAAHA
jgi:hypothetical protein